MPRTPSTAVIALVTLAAACGGEGSAAPPERESEPIGGVPVDSVYGASYAENLRVVPVEVEVRGLPDGWAGVRIAAVSDLALGAWEGSGETTRAVLTAIEREDPDLVVLLGRTFWGEGAGAEERQLLAPLAERALFALAPRSEVAADTGSAAAAPAPRGEELLRSLGALVLEDNRAIVIQRGDTGYVYGLTGLTDPATIKGLGVPADSTERDHPALLLLDDPATAFFVPPGRFALALAGGVVCGDGTVPGVPNLWTLNQGPLGDYRVEGAERLYRVGANGLLLVCGSGFGFLPVRFAGPPEVALITLVGIADPEEAETFTAADEDTIVEEIEEANP
ncbi:MAG: hypothetical protein ACREKN_05500 [Longimicrobiaceae bacterium]